MGDAQWEAWHARTLDRVPVLQVATISPRGDPFLAPVRFHFDGEVLYIVAPADSEPAVHLRANRRLALLADRTGDLVEAVVVQGLGLAVRSEAETARVWEALEAKYPRSPSAEVRGTLVKVTPLRIVPLGGREGEASNPS